MKKYILTTLSAALLFASCDTVDFGDTNQNINGPSKIDPAGLMTGAILDYSNNAGRIYATNPTLYVQYQTQNVYLDETRYSDVAQDWSEYYVRAFGNLNILINFLNVPANVTPTVLSQGSLNNQLGVAKIMKAIVTKRITDMYGDIPYTEAGAGLDFLNPKYDTQEFVYKAMIADLKSGRDMLNSAQTAPKGDVLYSGNVSKWKKLANSVLLQATLQLSKRYPLASGYSAVEFNSALSNAAGVITTVADEPWFKYITADGVSNPYFASRPADYDVTSEFAQSLKGTGSLNRTSNHTSDPRL
ncbi:SusD/RagB family nutrient-binding outer membrane lipoprotein, partial [Flavobacterium sp.]|uniref:SusD/RagB family nutrient-binding outer membrane lipoprotein n=1 Tax=Flavobacterium sp. TaxID=239 RepID=UPI002604A90B